MSFNIAMSRVYPLTCNKSNNTHTNEGLSKIYFSLDRNITESHVFRRLLMNCIRSNFAKITSVVVM